MKSLGDLFKGDLLKQAQAMQERMAEAQARIAALEVEGRSGGGLVRLVLSGTGQLKKVSIDPSLLSPAEAEVLEDLLVAAHADARAKSEGKVAEEMAAVTGGLPLPPGFKLPV